MQGMKSAYELAMERLNKESPVTQLTEEQKARLGELDSKYTAKIAEKEIFLNEQIEKAVVSGDMEAHESLKRQLAMERQVLESELEDKKELVRQGKD
jgi:hypothetical protein